MQQIFDKIRVAVFKNRVRTIEFFKDYDKLRSGIITENQFVCGLSLAIGKEAQLSRAETQKVVEYYRQPDERVRYKEFCDMMENGESFPRVGGAGRTETHNSTLGLINCILHCREIFKEQSAKSCIVEL